MIGTAERKILIVFVYYVFLAVFALLTFSLSIRNEDQFITEVLKYFKCESKGIDPDNTCDTNGYLKHRQVALISISHILLGLYPVVNLIFVINFQELKKHMKKWIPCRRGRVNLS